MKQKFNRGFTLIELLVVIAIIGILSSVVLASLNTARNKGSDAAIKSNLANIRSQAEIIYDGSGCYNNTGAVGGDCTILADDGDCAAANTEDDSIFENPTVAGQILAAATASGQGLAGAECVASANGVAWVVTVPLKTAGQYWCVDSTGASKQTAAQQGAADVTC